MTNRGVSLCLAMVLAMSLVPASAQADELPSVVITTNWVGDGSTGTQHAYTLTFSDNGTYGVEVDMVHQRDGTVLASSHNLAWDSAAGVRTALLTFDTTLALSLIHI